MKTIFLYGKTNKILFKIAPTAMLVLLSQALYNIVVSLFDDPYFRITTYRTFNYISHLAFDIAIATCTGVGIDTIMASKALCLPSSVQ